MILIPNHFTFGSQNFRLLSALNYGPVNTHELLHDPGLSFGSHVRRMKDVRDYLKEYGYTITKKRLNRKCWEYRISPLSEKVSWWQHIKNLFKQRQEALLNG